MIHLNTTYFKFHTFCYVFIYNDNFVLQKWKSYMIKGNYVKLCMVKCDNI